MNLIDNWLKKYGSKKIQKQVEQEIKESEKLCNACDDTFTHNIDYNGYCSSMCRDGEYAK